MGTDRKNESYIIKTEGGKIHRLKKISISSDCNAFHVVNRELCNKNRTARINLILDLRKQAGFNIILWHLDEPNHFLVTTNADKKKDQELICVLVVPTIAGGYKIGQVELTQTLLSYVLGDNGRTNGLDDEHKEQCMPCIFINTDECYKGRVAIEIMEIMSRPDEEFVAREGKSVLKVGEVLINV